MPGSGPVGGARGAKDACYVTFFFCVGGLGGAVVIVFVVGPCDTTHARHGKCGANTADRLSSG